MGLVSPYHTNSPEYSHREVHHNREDCFEGKKIEREHKDYGTGNKPLCKECIKLA
jgi:hypothetical protein